MNKIVSTYLLRYSVYIAVILPVTPLYGQTHLTDYVNPFIGTGGHGHTFPGAVVPFGMVQLSPDTRIDGSWDGCSGYHYSDSVIYGFSHTHLSGTGISDYGDVMLMPVVGKKAFLPKEYASSFNHVNEKAEAGYYRVLLDNGVKTELTTTQRVGMHQYTFPENANPTLVFDFSHRDECTEALLTIESTTRISGFRRSKAWAQDQYVAFVIEFSQPITSHTVSVNGVENHSREITQTNATINFNFNKSGAPLLAKVALSMVDIDGARKNLNTELPHWNFDQVKNEARTVWNQELGKIRVESTNQNNLIVFYTALYHAFTHPSVASDLDGRYRGMDKKIYQSSEHTHYTIFSLWDTFRALHPLLTIIDQKRTNDFIQSFLLMYQQGGRLPVWELAANETDCMIGYHSASVVADAAVKGIGNFDRDLALEALKKSATWPHLGIPAYITGGVITIDDEHESVSKTLEYAYDDFCVAQLALLRGKQTDADAYLKRSLQYRNTLDHSIGFMRPKKNGGWLSPFDPREVNNHFTEANAWQYSFFVPHDVTGHIKQLGGVAAYEKKLDELFSTSSKTTGREQADITGLIGQYAHGNEPSHHMAYLYNYLGKPYKTQQRTRQIVETLYQNAPDGLSGNEDCGQMSAWFVLSSIGLYQVTPGTTDFNITSPLFSRITLQLENGNTFRITTDKDPGTHPLIGEAILNQARLSKPGLDFTDMMKGGELKLSMTPNERVATMAFKEPLRQEIHSAPFVLNPVLTGASTSFKGTTEVEIHGCNGCAFYYTTDNTEPSEQSHRYTAAIQLNETTTLKAIAVNPAGYKSSVVPATFYKFPNKWDLQLNCNYNAQYTAGGDEGIIDGIRGSENWRKGEWQGYQYQDFEVIIDLKELKTISEVGAGFLQDTRSWILMPVDMKVEISRDGKKFSKGGTVNNSVAANDYTVQTQNLRVALKNQKARFVKIKATNFGKLPPWHQGHPFNGDAFIFVDEVWVR